MSEKCEKNRPPARFFFLFGPHRDDVLVTISGREAKLFASQGQCTTLTLSLRLCSIQYGEKNNKDTLIFLLDDALTFLDAARTLKVLPLLKGKGQIFFATSSKPDRGLDGIPRFMVVDGRVQSE